MTERDEDDERRTVRSGSWHHDAEKLLGDVGLRDYRTEIKNTFVVMGDALFEEFRSGVLFDWEKAEPVRPDKVRVKRNNSNGVGFRYVDVDFDQARDGPAFDELHKEWRVLKKDYGWNKRKAWPFIMTTLNYAIKLEVEAHPTFDALQAAGDTLVLWELLDEVSQGACANNVSTLTDEWKALRYVSGTSITRFLTTFDGLISQIDHAAGVGESKMSNNTKCWQLTKAFYRTWH
jgi:hypothetical protein